MSCNESTVCGGLKVEFEEDIEDERWGDELKTEVI